MKSGDENELVRYVTRRENLPHTLQILELGEKIRLRVFRDFWDAVLNHLQRSVPRVLHSRELSWKVWPDPLTIQREDVGVYMWPSEFTGQEQMLSYGVAIEAGQSLFFGVCWEKQPGPGLSRLTSVRRLEKRIATQELEASQWWPGWQYIAHSQQRDGLLLEYARERQRVHRQIQQSFWPFVEKTFEIVLAVNDALR